MDRREKEFENIRRMGGYRATMMLTDYPYNGMAYPQYPPFGVPPQGMPMYPSPYGNQMYNGGYPGGPTNMPYPMPPQQGYPMQQQYYQEEGGYEDPKMLEMREKWLEAERVKDGINVDRRASGMPYAVPRMFIFLD